MATPAQRDLVLEHIADAVAAGGRVLTGGGEAPAGNNFVAPTILVDVDESMACIREESFGPTIPIVAVADAAEAVALANASRYGLSATVWTRNRARGERIARTLDVGAVNINDAFTNLFAMKLPQGGWKSSGIGSRLGGADGLRKYTRRTAITAPRAGGLPWEPLRFPYGPARGRFVRRLMWTATTHGRYPLQSVAAAVGHVRGRRCGAGLP